MFHMILPFLTYRTLTTLMQHINVPDEDIIGKCGVNLVLLGPTKYGIIKNIRTPQPQPPKPPSTSNKRTKDKVTCRDSTRTHGKKPTRGRGGSTGTRSSSRTLSSSRQQNYGINPSQPPRVSKRPKPQIDYLALNDGLEEESPTSPKRRKRSSTRPGSEPSSRRLWAQRQMGSPNARSIPPGVPSTLGDPSPNSTDAKQKSASLVGVQTAPELRSSTTELAFSGVPSTSGDLDPNTLDTPDQPSTLSGVQLIPELETTGNSTLTGIQPSETLPDLVLQNTANQDNGDQELNAARVLLSLGDSLDTTADDVEDNAMLMPIGGGESVPVDVAPQPIQLDQINVDAAIADIVQTEENQPNTRITDDLQVEQELNDDTSTVAAEDTNPDDDVPLATLAKTLDTPKSPVKGVLKTKTYGLKKKTTSNRTFKCPLCETWKSTTQRLNEHFKRRHPPLQCGICGRSFTIPSSLSRHMYDHDERRYNCNKCSQSFHFESELISHRVSHRSKSKPTFQCMKSKCGKWFMRKWDLTLHLQKHSSKKFTCEYKDCDFWTNSDKQLKEHYKSHSDDCTVKCKLCGKGFRYRSGLKRHRDSEHKDHSK